MHKFLLFLTTSIITIACNENQPSPAHDKEEMPKGSYWYDKNFLLHHDTNIVELRNGSAAVLVSPAYQGKVFTSTAEGNNGKSFGWINYKAFGAAIDPHMNAYGGENRFWLGPEGGKYSLYFRNGDSMIFDNWKTPAPIDTESWTVEKKDDHSVTLKKDISITNYSGSQLSMQVTRTISIQDKNEMEKVLSVEPGDSVKSVGYATSNVLKNTGDKEWNEQTGMPCIWILDMFNPSSSTTIVVPHKPGKGKKVANTGYFGEIPGDRIVQNEHALFFKADGTKRGKLGILPEYALPFAGSYDAQDKMLTITNFTVESRSKYLNQEWNIAKPVFSGDAMNAYNDGPIADGSQMGPFYEIESVSPAAALKPGAEIQHMHNVYHFTGSEEQLDKIARKVLGVSLDDIKNAFK